MGATLGLDLRLRVVRAMDEEGLSIRNAGRRFRIGESTAGRWYRQWRETGDIAPAHKGNPGHSRLDAFEAFLLGLIEDDGRDITLVEMAARLKLEHGETVDPSTIHNWLHKRGVTFKKRQRMRASRPGRMLPSPDEPGLTTNLTLLRKS